MNSRMKLVIDSLLIWHREYYEADPEDRNEKAILCVEKALDELNKYYS